MAATTPNTIVLSDQPYVQDEKLANNVAIKPGDLVALASATAIGLHATAGGNARPLFALENPYADPGSPAIDTAYGTADQVRYVIGKGGDKVYGWLTVGASVAVGTYLESAGSLGALRALTASGSTHHRRAVGVAAETVNNSAGGAKARIRVEVI